MADLSRERTELETDPAAERREVMATYVARGLAPYLERQVAEQLMTRDAPGAQARDELGISEAFRAQPVQAALASAASFAIGAALPLAVTALIPGQGLILWVSVTSIAFLAALGGLSARAGGAGVVLGARRVTFWGALAMAITAGVGRLFGAAARCSALRPDRIDPARARPVCWSETDRDRLRALAHRLPQVVGVAWLRWYGLQAFFVVFSAVGRSPSPSEYEIMMNGGMWGIGWMGGDGGIWVPILVAILAIGFVAWFINGRRK